MAGKKALVLSAQNFEDTELICPMNRLQEAGYTIDLAAPQSGDFKGKVGYTAQANMSVSELPEDPGREYELLLLPGGKAPAELRKLDKAIQAAKSFDALGKPIAAICHGPQILITAGLLQGKNATCYSSVVEELKEAGANYLDQEVVVEGTYVFSRYPGDIPAFNREMMKQLDMG